MNQGGPRKYLEASSRLADRRLYPRFPHVAAVEVVEPISQTRVDGRTTEISLGGCYVTTANPLPPKTIIRISIHIEGIPFHSWARVVYNHTGVGMGIAFFDTAPDQRTHLKAFLAKLAT